MGTRPLQAQHVQLLKRQHDSIVAAGDADGIKLQPRKPRGFGGARRTAAREAAEAAERAQSEAALRTMRSDVAAKGLELQKLHEQLAYQEQMAAAFEKELAHSRATLSSGVLLSWPTTLMLLTGGVAAGVALRRRRNRRLKGYEVLVVPKDT